jgi:hypothetical protein
VFFHVFHVFFYVFHVAAMFFHVAAMFVQRFGCILLQVHGFTCDVMLRIVCFWCVVDAALHVYMFWC